MNHLGTEGVGPSLYYHGLRACGATSLRRLTKNAGLILCYHNIVWSEDDVRDPELHIPLSRFERQIRWLVDHYDVVSLSTFVDRLLRAAPLNETAVITFDDGYAGVFDYAVPFLDDVEVPATVFVIAEAPGRSTGFWWDRPEVVTYDGPRRERWLTDLRGEQDAILSDVHAESGPGLPMTYWPADWSEIRSAARGQISIGVHSATHRTLTTLGDDELEDEIKTSRLIVQQWTGCVPDFFAYPYGLWDARIRAAVRAAGYRASLAHGYGLNDPTADPWALRRMNVPAGISDAAFEAWTAGFHVGRA
jgi:peptidoglycan/xylan/chitin deacetylase (PgdA/CDA1 family)